MSPSPPIACSLSSDELAGRLAEIRALGKDALLSVSPDGALRFRADQASRRRLEAIIAAESLCCPFLSFDLHEEPGALMLCVEATDGGEPVAGELVRAFASDAGEALSATSPGD